MSEYIELSGLDYLFTSTIFEKVYIAGVFGYKSEYVNYLRSNILFVSVNPSAFKV